MLVEPFGEVVAVFEVGGQAGELARVVEQLELPGRPALGDPVPVEVVGLEPLGAEIGGQRARLADDGLRPLPGEPVEDRPVLRRRSGLVRDRPVLDELEHGGGIDFHRRVDRVAVRQRRRHEDDGQ